jgi:hypothetical protein
VAGIIGFAGLDGPNSGQPGTGIDDQRKAGG